MTAGVAIAAIPGVWEVHAGLSTIEPAGYRKHSVYVQTMTRVADAGTLYFAVLAAVAVAALVVAITARRRAARAAASISGR